MKSVAVFLRIDPWFLLTTLSLVPKGWVKGVVSYRCQDSANTDKYSIGVYWWGSLYGAK